MKSAYNDVLMQKYGITEDDAEIISELKRRIRKISPLSKEQKEGCEVCGVSNKEEEIYNHHIMKVEYLAILAYYYGLYKKEKNPNYVENRGTSEEEINTTSDKEYIYVLRKNVDLYIPRVAICERHHSMLHELAGDFEGQTNKDLLRKAKPKELENLYDILSEADKNIYTHIFENNDSLDGREYYLSYLKIWNDTMQVTMGNLLDQIDKRLDRLAYEHGKKNIDMLTSLRENVSIQKDEAIRALDALNESFEYVGDETVDLTIDKETLDIQVNEDEKENENENERTNSHIESLDLASEFKDLSIEDLEEIYEDLISDDNEKDKKESQSQDEDEEEAI